MKNEDLKEPDIEKVLKSYTNDMVINTAGLVPIVGDYVGFASSTFDAVEYYNNSNKELVNHNNITFANDEIMKNANNQGDSLLMVVENSLDKNSIVVGVTNLKEVKNDK